MSKIEEMKILEEYILKNVSESVDVSLCNSSNVKQIFSIDKLKNHVINLSATEELGNYKDLLRFYSEISPIHFFVDNINNDEYFDCYFKGDSFAWISKDKQGLYRYFSKNRTTKTFVSYNLVDLFEIYTNSTVFRALDKVTKLLNVPFLQDEWLRKEREKYFYNISMIHTVKDIKMSDNLRKTVMPFLKYLQIINSIGMTSIRTKEMSFDDNSAFFFSTNYLSHFIGDSQGTVSKVINFLSLLGLICKVPMAHVPLNYRYSSYRQSEEKRNHINYYTVPLFDDAIAIAEKRIGLIISHKIKYSNLSREKIVALWGDEFAKTIYPQEHGVKEESKQDSKITKVSEFINKKLTSLDQFLLREDVISWSMKEKISKNFVITNWDAIVRESNCVYYKVSKVEAEYRGLDKQNYILTKVVEN